MNPRGSMSLFRLNEWTSCGGHLELGRLHVTWQMRYFSNTHTATWILQAFLYIIGQIFNDFCWFIKLNVLFFTSLADNINIFFPKEDVFGLVLNVEIGYNGFVM